MVEVVRCEDVTIRRGTKLILNNVNWRVAAGERWVVLGPNGAGKTTLLQIAAGLMHPTTGTAHLLGERLGAVDVFELRPRIGFASTALAARIPKGETVLDVVRTAAYAKVGRWHEGYEEADDQRARDLLAALGVGDLLQRHYGSLSSGERKRVQIARALMPDPELLLLDEPAAGLDLGGREQLVANLSALSRDEFAPVLVMVTHHVEEIPAGFTHALLLKDGAVTAAGPIESTLTPQHLSHTFDVNLIVEHHQGRWAARAMA